MKGFALDETGDLRLEHGRISMLEGEELLRQTCQCVLGTNRGEWELNPQEGIDRRVLLPEKCPDEDAIQAQILSGLQQVDESFELKSFSCTVTKERQLVVDFCAVNGEGRQVVQERREG